MKHLAILGFALAALATPVQAQSQQKSEAPVYSFNGNVFDPPTVEHHATASSQPQRHVSPRTIQAKPPAAHTPLSFNGNVFD